MSAGKPSAAALEAALDEARGELFRARSIVDMAMGSLAHHFSGDIPIGVPDWPRALLIVLADCYRSGTPAIHCGGLVNGSHVNV